MTLNRAATELPLISFKISDDLQKKISHFHNFPGYHNDQNITIDDIYHALNRVNVLLAKRDLYSSQRVTLEKYKLALMQNAVDGLACLAEEVHPKKAKKQPESWVWYWCKVAGLVLFSLVGFVQSNILSFVGIQSLINTLLPAIAFPGPIIISVIITIVFAAQYLVFNVNSLRELLGIKVIDHKKSIMHVHEKQIQLTKTLNDHMSDANIIPHLHRKEYSAFRNIAISCNHDILEKRKTYKEYKKSPFVRAVTYIFLGLGAIFTACYGYFGATSLLALVAAPLLGTPVGWGIVAGLMLTGLIFYFALQVKSTTRAMNPLMDLFEKIKEKVNSFRVKDEMDFAKTLANDRIFKPEDSCENELRTSKDNMVVLDVARPVLTKASHDVRLFRSHDPEKLLSKYQMDLALPQPRVAP